MDSAIIYAALPENPRHDDLMRGQGFLVQISKAEQDQYVARLGDYVWQVNFRESPYGLAQIVAACEQFAVPYRILPLDGAQRWIERNPSL